MTTTSSEPKKPSTSRCDGCGKQRRDVKTQGVDRYGDPDGPDMCFLCRKEANRGRHFSISQGKYVKHTV